MVKCGYCRPHAHPAKNRLCTEGQRLFDAYAEASRRWGEIAMHYDPPQAAIDEAKQAKNEARRAYRAHTDGA